MNLLAEQHPISIYYCKAGLKTGLTVRVEHAGARWACGGVTFQGVTGDIIHGNAEGKAKRSGARCVAVIHSGVVTLINPQLLA